jgi:hypothetical protein
MSSAKRDKRVFDLAESFLNSLTTKDGFRVTQETLSKYFQVEKPETVADIYFRLLLSAQNANMKAGVIGGSIDGIENLRDVLCDFEPKAIIKKYGDNSQQVFTDIKKQVKPRGKVNTNGLWSKYCDTIISGAKFLGQFNSAEDFYEWTNWFYKDERARPALPLLLKEEINGFGFALACDFLKEIGFLEYGKPDVWLRKIFVSLDLCSPEVTDSELLKVIIRVAQNAGATPYKVDKVFWLIGSGNFYLDSRKTRRNAENFIEFVKSQ